MKKTVYLWFAVLAFVVMACGGAKGKLVGMWTIESISGKTPPTEMTMEFKADGSFQQSKKKKNGNGSDTRMGKWEVAKDAKSMTLMPEGGGKTENVEIITLDGTSLTFKDDRNEFRLKKKK